MLEQTIDEYDEFLSLDSLENAKNIYSTYNNITDKTALFSKLGKTNYESIDVFVEKFKEPLLMHWNREIDTVQLGTIIRLVNKKKYTVDDAIQAVINDDF